MAALRKFAERTPRRGREKPIIKRGVVQVQVRLHDDHNRYVRGSRSMSMTVVNATVPEVMAAIRDALLGDE